MKTSSSQSVSGYHPSQQLPSGVWLLQWVLMWGLVMIPLVFSKYTTHAVVLKDVFLFYVAAMSVGLIIVLCGWHAFPKALRQVLLPLLLYTAYLAIRATATGYPHLSWPTMVWITSGFVIMVAFAITSNYPKFVHLWFLVLSSVVGLISAYAWIQVLELDPYQWDPFPWALPIRRVCGTFANPTYLASFLIMVLPLLVLHTKQIRQSRRWLWGIYLLLVGGALVFTFSRAAVISLCASGAFILAVMWINHHSAQKLARLGIVLAVGLVVIGALVVLMWVGYNNWDVFTAWAQFYDAFIASWPTRTLLFRGTAQMIAERPWWGWGTGLFSVFYPDYRDPELAWWEPPGETFVGHAHCEYLEQAAELGLVGLGLWVWLIVSVFKVGLVGLKTLTPHTRRLALGLMAGMVGQLSTDLVSVTFRWTSSFFMFWCLAGVLLGIVSHSPQKYVSRRAWTNTIVGVVLMAIGVTTVTSIQSKWLMADLFFKGAQGLSRIGEDQKSLLAVEKSLEFDPLKPEALYFYGARLYSQQKFTDAVKVYEFLRRKHGNVANSVYNQATCLMQYALARSDPQQRQQLLQESLQLYAMMVDQQPYLPEARMAFARALDASGDHAQAREQLDHAITVYEKILTRRPNHHLYRAQLVRCLVTRGDHAKALKEVQILLERDPDNQMGKALQQTVLERMQSSATNTNAR